MFGNGMMKKLQEMQAKVEETKERLNHIKLIGEAKDGAVRVEVNGNGVITSIETREEGLAEKELIALIQTAANRALEQANRTKEMEMAQSAKGIVPGM
jgi:DNA-binding protein YbaB